MIGETKRGLGRAIMNGIIHEGLISAVEPGLSVWSANADEMLEAIVADWKANAKECQRCHSFATMGEDVFEYLGFVCTDCLPPTNEV